MFVQFVHINIKPGNLDAFLHAIRINHEGTRKEPGNIRFDLLGDPDDEYSFSIYEVFQSETALEDHRRSKHYKTCMAIIEPIIAGRVSKIYFKAVLI